MRGLRKAHLVRGCPFISKTFATHPKVLRFFFVLGRGVSDYHSRLLTSPAYTWVSPARRPYKQQVRTSHARRQVRHLVECLICAETSGECRVFSSEFAPTHKQTVESRRPTALFSNPMICMRFAKNFYLASVRQIEVSKKVFNLSFVSKEN